MSSRGNWTGGSSSQELGTEGGMDTGRSAAETSGGPAVQEPEYSSVQTVFGQVELLEHILDYAIHDENVKTLEKTLKAVRLVGKSWLTGVTNVMRRNKEPIFMLELTQENSLKDSHDVEAQGKLLDRFTQSVKNRVEEPFPTFSLEIQKEFFRRENYDGLVDFLRQCARGLVELTMIIPEHGGSLPGVLPIVDLPILQKLVLTFTQEKAADNMSGMELDFGHPTNVICLIQSFLSKAHSLKEFLVPSIQCEDEGDTIVRIPPAPRGFEFVTLPECITSLELHCATMTSEQLELLVRNKLPNLLKLWLLLEYMSCAGVLSKILANFCEHLRSLTLIGAAYNGPPRITNFVRFSEMKALTCLTSSGITTFELEDHHPMLNKCFSKLDSLNISNQTPEMLRKWTMGTPLHSVKALSVSLADENKAQRSSDYVLPINLDSMQSIHLAFPNIRKLSLMLPSVTQACGLNYLYTEMKQLKSLRIYVRGSESINNSDHWDSIFTGVPIPVVAGLRESPDYWTHFQLNESAPCIKMLTDLEKLSLKVLVEGTDAQATQPLISDLTFVFALLKMPKLQKLSLNGRFKASDIMTETWKKDGRCLNYTTRGL